MLSRESRRLAGILLVVLPTVLYGGYFLLTQLINPDSGYMQNPLRQNLFRAGHAHAGVLLVLSLVALRYVDEAQLSEGVEALRALLDSLGSHLSACCLFLFRIVTPCDCPQWLHLPGLHRRRSFSHRPARVGGGIIEGKVLVGYVPEYRRILESSSRSQCAKSVGFEKGASLRSNHYFIGPRG